MTVEPAFIKITREQIISEPNLPPRPAGLTPAADDQNTAVLVTEGNIALVIGGVSLLGEGGHIVAIISIMQADETRARGCTLAVGHPNRELGFEFFDTSVEPLLSESPFPDTMTYFVGRTDDISMLNADASPERLAAIARFVMPFISDEGPPKGIDWPTDAGLFGGP